MKLVKVARVGNKLKEVALDGNATIADALRAAMVTVGTMEEVWLGHDVVTKMDFDLPNGSVLIVEPKRAASSCGCPVCGTFSSGRERYQISLGMRSLIRFLDNEGMLDPEYDEEGENIDFQETYRSNKDFLDRLVKTAKEA